MPSSQNRSSAFERHPVLTLFILIAVSFVVLDFTVTFATGLIRDRLNTPVASTAEIDPNKGYRARSDIYHHDLEPNATSAIATWGNAEYRVYTDSLGFKSDRVKTTPIKSDRKRILFIGDSFTEGVGMEYEDTFVGRVGASLAARDTDVLNAGVSSYSPIIYWRKIKYLIEEVGLDIDNVVVFLDISDIQDEASSWKLSNNGTVEEANPTPIISASMNTNYEIGGLKGWIKRRLMFSFFLLDTAHDLIYPEKGYAIDLERSLWTVDQRLMDDFGRVGLKNATRHMNLLRDLLSEHDIPLSLAVYPWPDQIVRRDLQSPQVSHWETWATDKQVTFLNYFPCFVNNQSSVEILKAYYIPRDVHWNADGHQLVAKEFTNSLKAGTGGGCLEVSQ